VRYLPLGNRKPIVGLRWRPPGEPLDPDLRPTPQFGPKASNCDRLDRGFPPKQTELPSLGRMHLWRSGPFPARFPSEAGRNCAASKERQGGLPRFFRKLSGCPGVFECALSLSRSLRLPPIFPPGSAGPFAAAIRSSDRVAQSVG